MLECLRAGDHQGVDTPWPLSSAQKGAQKNTKPPEYTKKWSSTRAGEEEAQRRGTGGQGLETQPSLVPKGTGPQVEAGRGGKGGLRTCQK